jgi:branched-chain amino acid transport system ATP-binding protein
MREPILETVNLVKRFGAVVATDDVSLSLFPEEVHAIIGPNGAGKTTLLAQLAGELSPTSGHVRLDGRDITGSSVPARSQRGIARSFQITSLCLEFSVLDNVALAVQARQGHSFRFWRRVRRDELINAPARRLLDLVGLGARTDIPAGSLAHGEQRQLEVAVALACRPRILLLDEPMAGMGREESRRMMRLLASLKGRQAMLLIEHDMDAVFTLADRITVLVYGRTIMTGTPREVASSVEVRNAYLGEPEVAHA